MISPSLTVLVTGASGLLGSRLIIQLSESGYYVIAMGRHSCPDEMKAYCQWIQIDLEKPQPPKQNIDILIHAAPLWLLPVFFRELTSRLVINRCIAFSSTSAESKAHAADIHDRQIANKLLTAESESRRLFNRRVNYTILRPTLIYGYGKDQNISVIAKFISRYRFFPVAGKASGLRQPVHVDDLVKTAISIINNETTFGKTYTLSGGETFTYRKMIEKIFGGLARPIHIVNLPVCLYRLLLKIKISGYSVGTADRMNQDLSYTTDDSILDFNYQPQSFLINPKRDLPRV